MRNELKTILAKLIAIKEKVERFQANAEDDQDEERSERLEQEIAALDVAIESLQEIE